MTTKADFNAEEWQQIMEGPALAGLIVITAQRGGTLRESLSMAKAYKEGKLEHGSSELIGAIVERPPQMDPRRYSSPEDMRQQGLGEIGDAVELLASRATSEEVDQYKRFTMTVAQRAAEADKSGGFLGIGGERVSDSEREALAALADTLGVEAPATGE